MGGGKGVDVIGVDFAGSAGAPTGGGGAVFTALRLADERFRFPCFRRRCLPESREEEEDDEDDDDPLDEELEEEEEDEEEEERL